MPFMAYYGASTGNVSMVEDAANQLLLYRNILLANTTESWQGLWVHIVGPQSQTLGIWATGNGWAALGMARVLATLQKYGPSKSQTALQGQLVSAMMSIFTGLNGVDVSVSIGKDKNPIIVAYLPFSHIFIRLQHDPSTGLLRNYLIGDSNNQNIRNVSWFGDASGSAALVASALRLAVLQSSTCNNLYHASRPIRDAVVKSIGVTTGIASPTVNPYSWFSTGAYTQGESIVRALAIVACC